MKLLKPLATAALAVTFLFNAACKKEKDAVSIKPVPASIPVTESMPVPPPAPAAYTHLFTKIHYYMHSHKDTDARQMEIFYQENLLDLNDIKQVRYVSPYGPDSVNTDFGSEFLLLSMLAGRSARTDTFTTDKDYRIKQVSGEEHVTRIFGPAKGAIIILSYDDDAIEADPEKIKNASRTIVKNASLGSWGVNFR